MYNISGLQSTEKRFSILIIVVNGVLFHKVLQIHEDGTSNSWEVLKAFLVIDKVNIKGNFSNAVGTLLVLELKIERLSERFVIINF